MKYKFTGKVRIQFGIELKQIIRIADNLIGGWIEKESNLSQVGNAWVYGDASVSGNAQVYGNAQVSGNARVYGDASVYGNASVSGNALVEKTTDIIVVSNLQFSITVTLQNCVIGCKIKLHKEWLKVTLKEAIGMGLSKENYKFYKTLVPILFKQVGKY